MAIKKVFDLAVKTGTYEQSGETKNRYRNVGSILESDNGMFILLDKTFNPAGVHDEKNQNSVLISMFKKDNEIKKSAPVEQPITAEDINWSE